MRVRRFVPMLVCSLALASTLPALADAPAWMPFASSNQSSADNSAGMKQDDSEIIVVRKGDPDPTAPIVDTATKKKPQTFWTKLWHPTTWFASSKKK
ncbi:MAG TPA: hypothetical protein VGJ15_12340 [Pirellulales bacterium]|jgi:hypothetical protein